MRRGGDTCRVRLTCSPERYEIDRHTDREIDVEGGASCNSISSGFPVEAPFACYHLSLVRLASLNSGPARIFPAVPNFNPGLVRGVHIHWSHDSIQLDYHYPVNDSIQSCDAL